MSETRWVQHVSGKGEKWEVVHSSPVEWVIEKYSRRFNVPASEYRLIEPPEPPERWVEVTEQCEVSPDLMTGRNIVIDFSSTHRVALIENGYRLRKMPTATCQYCAPCTAFIVEKRER